MIEVIFKEKDEKLFLRYWQEVTANSSFRYFPSVFRGSDDKSFIFLVDNKPTAAVLFPLGREDVYVDAPIFLDQSVEKKIFQKIDELAKENNFKKIKFQIDPLENYRYNYLQKYGYLDTSIISYVIDLTKDNLLSECRKGHRNEIKKIKNDNDFSVFFIDKENSNYNINEEYRKLHHKCSGRVTRPKETFDAQFERLKQGRAVLFGLKHKNKNVAFCYFEYNKDKAVYYSGSDDPDYNQFSLYHSLVFAGMEYLKEKGVKHLDTGQPSCPSPQFDYCPDQKQLNIALFKRGFGGQYLPLYRGVKYYSEEEFKKDAQCFSEKYYK